MRTIEYEIDRTHDGMQVGGFLRGKGYSRALLTMLKNEDGLALNGSHIRTVDTIKSGDVITVTIKDVSGAVPNASLNAYIAYDDDDVVVFDKPSGMPVHTSYGHNDDTLENLFAALYPEHGFHAVSRLDRNTSGLITVAKNKYAASRLMSDERYRPKKVYYAVTGIEAVSSLGESGEITAPIARESDSVIKRTVRDDGEYARTIFKAVKKNDRYCLYEVTLATGRTHQIRVHFAYCGFPLIGDELYGGDTSMMRRHALHCGSLSFIQPVKGDTISLRSDIPSDISALFDNEITKYGFIT